MGEADGIYPTDRSCLVCNRMIVRAVASVYDPASGPMCIGPGSENQLQQVITYHCEHCGIQYKFLPPKDAAPRSRGLDIRFRPNRR